MSKHENNPGRLVVGRATPASGKPAPVIGRPFPVKTPGHVLTKKIAAEDDAAFISRSSGPMQEDWPESGIEVPVPQAADHRKEIVGEGVDGGGMRLNAGKNPMELIPPEWEWALADIMTQGAKKYDARNWEQGMAWGTMIACIKRHVNKFMAGERYDGEEFDLEAGTTGCHHLTMVAWNALALMTYDLRQIGTNDLPENVQLELFDRVNGGTSDLPLNWGGNDDNT